MPGTPALPTSQLVLPPDKQGEYIKDQVLAFLEKNLPENQVETALRSWFLPLHFEYSPECVYILFPHSFFGLWFRQHGQSHVEKALAQCFPTIKFAYGEQKPGAATQEAARPAPPAGTEKFEAGSIGKNTAPPQAEGEKSPSWPSHISIDTHHDAFRFENFIPGKKNSFPLSVLMEAAQPHPPVSPILIRGPHSSGKSHLLGAVTRTLRQFSEMGPLFYGNAQNFTALFGQGSRAEFRQAREYLNACSAFLLDDIHTLTEAPDLQQELVFLLDTLHKKPFICTACPIEEQGFVRHATSVAASESTAPGSSLPSSANIFPAAPSPAAPFTKPGMPPTLSSALLSRLSSGLVLTLAPADLDVRLRFVQTRLAEQEVELGQDSQLFLARRCTDLRHLAGTIVRIKTTWNYTGTIPTNAEMETMLSASGSANFLTADMVVALVAQYFGLTIKDIKGKKRHANLVLARQIAMYLCRALLGESYPNLGQVFGGKDHSTVMHGVKKISESLVSNKDIHKAVTDLTLRCRHPVS